ncbi:hypothetical protein J2Z69_003515 [Paenibacillus shirakamiensis]|uniref:Scaffold protein Nfu/NifU N-terminal domain-containing protein n=1 Tax=Paenibacillus shirakamiensis TaxID=1265935 RepID=A0ABS4JL50_9BACL|nr:virulence factor [Paenibacillus shirakamiensis]MBP2002442.1 hypothetical protein [Paenibacillus shirakamiensis]
MKIVFIEPTPSPNSMKLHLDETLAAGIRKTYTLENVRSAPVWIQDLLKIHGVKSVFHTADFVALDRKSSADWSDILASVQEQFGQEGVESAWSPEQASDAIHYGEAQVFVQFFRSIPMQIRVKSGLQEERISLSARFVQAVTEVASASLIKERKLVDYGVRYGELPDIAREIEQEIEAAFPADRLESLIQQAIAHGAKEDEFVEERRELRLEEVESRMLNDDWRIRYAALDALQPSGEALPLLGRALQDPQMQVRRLAVIYLGDIRSPEALALLMQALRDSSAAVRRTAGDTLSDIGDPVATGAMIEALSDRSKLVRWRAARFLYEVGTDEAREALQVAAGDPEFEVSLQARMALERIESGEEAAGTVWQQMAKRNDSSDA